MINIFRQFYKWWISHLGKNGAGYIDMSSDFELNKDQLPKGNTPIWIQLPRGASLTEMMEKVVKIPELKEYHNNVTVLYDVKDDGVVNICRDNGYKYIYRQNITGVEDKVAILLNTTVEPEYITRGINMLIIVNNHRWIIQHLTDFTSKLNYRRYEDLLQSAVDHNHKKCTKITSCQYNLKLIDKRILK